MMVQPAASFSRILPNVRPPTPPRESDPESKPPNLFSRLFTKREVKQTSQTSDITPNSSSESPTQAERLKKRVAWDDDKPSPESAVQPVPTSSGERKPIKSILKPHNGIGPKAKLSPPHTYANLAAMLESVAQQLAGKDRSSKMDAYTTLSGVLKASENVPDVRALKEKMGLLLSFIRRDLTAKTSTGALDTSLVVNALILLSIFLHRPVIADSITLDFSVHLVDHSIKTFEDASMSKDVVKHLMLILAEQRFSAKIMNADRVGRLITCLHDIENHVKGKSIVMGRINIYRTLLRQSRAFMLLNTDWLYDLFSDMFSTVKETKACAIAFGLEAGHSLGTESKASRAFMELFSGIIPADIGDGVKFGDYYAGRLKTMIEGKQDIASVPQIWSVPILFLRSKPRQFEQWAFMKTWLGIIQQCFNCSDQQAKSEANLAWNRLVFALQPDEKTAPQMIAMLYDPLRAQLRRKSKGRKAAFGSLCTLLYYALKPTSTSVQLDLYWDRYIVETINKTLAPRDSSTSIPELARQNLMDACRILISLFDSVTPRPWSEARAMDACTGKDASMETTELPALDSKWLRKSAGRVFPVIGPLIEKLYWDLGDETEPMTSLWKAYITSIASPAVKEVKVSNETMSCVACILGLLYKIWQLGVKSLHTVPLPEIQLSADFLSSFESIISITINGLGLLPFTEKLLSIGGEHEFVVIATPSHQPRKARGEPRYPLHHLFVLLANVSPGLEYDRKFSQMVRRILTPFLDARPSKRAKLDLIQDLLGLLPEKSNEPCRMIWSVLADLATFATDTRDELNNGATGKSDQPLGADYRVALKILEFGVDLSPTELLPGWKVLFEALVASATIDAGDAGRAIAVIEPLGRALQSKFSKADGQSNSRRYIYFRTVLSKATYPKDRQAFDAARRRLWGTVASKTSSFDPYNLLYGYMCESLQKAYTSFMNSLSLEYSDMISATTNLLIHCPTALLPNALAKLQDGIASWISDENSRIVGGTTLSHSITSLWSKTCQVIPTLNRVSDQSKLLADLEVLVCAGLESRHRSIVNSSIRLWNSTFGVSKEHLAYPSKIKDTLLRLRLVAELQLPFFPESLESDGVVDQRQLSSFAETQDISSNYFGSTGAESVVRVQHRPDFSISPTSTSRLKNYTPQVIIGITQSAPVKRSRESTPEPNNRKSRKRSIAPKLRHEDSQIQFEAIESSPIADAVLDSQLLTDRQKEVKERQRADSAIFPDLHSSPRAREKSRPSSSVELPLHRSASKSRAAASPVVEQQTTPTFVPQAEYDDYVNSSPTPTRALQNNALPDLPSSPPEAAEEATAPSMEDEANIPSSPPEMPQEMEIDTTTSLDPSAQVDPYAEENNRTLSTFESTDQHKELLALGTVAEADDPKVPVADEAQIDEVELGQSSQVPEQAEGEEPATAAPDTPTRGRQSSPALYQTPGSEVFLDAQTSPTSSDKHTMNDDIFEDAISSPQLNLNKANTQQVSSPISYLDESSAMRLMAGYDQASGRPRISPRRSARVSLSTANLSASASPTSSNNLARFVSSKNFPSATVSSGREQLLPPQGIEEAADKEPGLPIDEPEAFLPMPSLIPETPGPKAALKLQIVDGEKIDLNETIFVDDSALYEQDAPVAKGRKRKSDVKQSTVGSPASKKGKHQEMTSDLSEAPSNQEARPEIFASKMTTNKKRRGRPPKHSSRVSPLTRSRSQSLSQSFSSGDLGGLVQGMEVTTEIATSSAHKSIPFSLNKSVEDKRSETRRATDDVLVPSNGEPRIAEGNGEKERPNEDMKQTSSPPISNHFNTSDIEIIADTIMGDSSEVEKSSSAATNLDIEAQEEVDVREEIAISASKTITVSSKPMNELLPTQVDASMQTERVFEAPTAQGLKNKLQSIIDDLGPIVLSRDEMSELEDLFTDAKQLLYTAGQRGRAGS